MKNYLSIFLLAFCGCFFISQPSFGQVKSTTLSIQQSPISGLTFSSQDGINCIIQSTYSEPLNMYLTVQISSEKGFPVMMGQTNRFQVLPGLNKIDKSTVTLSDIKYINRDYGNYEQTNGSLPSGGYTVCISLKCGDESCFKQTNLWEHSDGEIRSCSESISINPTPLLLASPYDEAELTTHRPNFSWIPPMPIGTDPNLTYRFTLVELKKNQRGESGIRRNRPLFQMEGLSTMNLPFPGELQDLKVGSSYAWQVDALLGKTPVQTSEVWEFTIVEEEEEVFPMPYVRLKRTDDQIYNTLNELKFIYTQNGVSKKLKYHIKTINGNSLNLDLNPMDLKFGENSFKIDLRPFGLEHKKFYVLEIYSDKGEVYSLKFKYHYKKELK
ncbi:MAG: hypothetical protein COA58_04225 [Bacteroidetes bacterium]|nr:MAG: hypothetical protein COA58_04225 [Bacteroidota bacterium]